MSITSFNKRIQDMYRQQQVNQFLGSGGIHSRTSSHKLAAENHNGDYDIEALAAESKQFSTVQNDQ